MPLVRAGKSPPLFASMSPPVDLARCCVRVDGCGGHSGKPHILIEGKALGGVLWSKVAEPYPTPLGRVYGRTIASAVSFRNLRMLRTAMQPVQ